MDHNLTVSYVIWRYQSTVDHTFTVIYRLPYAYHHHHHHHHQVMWTAQIPLTLSLSLFPSVPLGQLSL